MLTDIIKTTFARLNKEGIPATPDMYRKYFCEEAKKLGVYTAECNSINSLKDSLTYKNRAKLKLLNIDSMDNLLDFLINQLENITKLPEKEEIEVQKPIEDDGNKANIQDLIGVVEIVKDALRPSVGNLYSDEIDDISSKITDNPELLTEEETQEIIKKLVRGRASFDRRSIINQTSELNKITDSISSSLTKSISLNQTGSTKMSQIKSKLNGFDKVDFSNKKHAEVVKNQFISIAGAIEIEASKLSQNLKNENNQINFMSKKISNLKTHLTNVEGKNNLDFLTKAYTKDGFEEILDNFEQEFQEKKIDYCGILIDLDYFKKVNKVFGYGAGDKILTTLAQLLLAKFGNIGKVCRHGGERFLIIIPTITVDEGAKIALMISNTLKKSSFTYNEEKIKVTISGAVCSRSNNPNKKDFISHLYKVLNKAKENGRNRIEICKLKAKQAL